MSVNSEREISRRKVLSAITTSIATQTKWAAPVVASVMLPNHAAASGRNPPSPQRCPTTCGCIIPGITFMGGMFPAFVFDAGSTCNSVNAILIPDDSFLRMDITGGGLTIIPYAVNWSSTLAPTTVVASGVGGIGTITERISFKMTHNVTGSTFSTCFLATYTNDGTGSISGSTSDVCIA